MSFFSAGRLRRWREAILGRTVAPAAPEMLPTPGLLRALGVADADAWAAALRHSCAEQGITTRARVAHFLATVLHETSGFTRLRESLDYTPAGLRRTWPNRFSEADAMRWGRGQRGPADQRAIAERAYGGRMGNGPEGSGDGHRFIGRGLIQLTGRANYEAAARAFRMSPDDLASWLESRMGATRVAAWWWEAHGCNALADAGDIVALRRRVNGGLIGIEDVRARLDRVLRAIGG